MVNTKPKSARTVRITINPELESMLEFLKTEFRGLDNPEIFKLALSRYYDENKKIRDRREQRLRRLKAERK